VQGLDAAAAGLYLSREVPVAAQRVLRRVAAKLEGVEHGPMLGGGGNDQINTVGGVTTVVGLPVDSYVQRIVEECQNMTALSQLYSGWSPWI